MNSKQAKKKLKGKEQENKKEEKAIKLNILLILDGMGCAWLISMHNCPLK